MDSTDDVNRDAPTIPDIPVSQIMVQVPSACLRNLYSAYIYSNQRGTFGGQELESQQLMIEAAVIAKRVLTEFDQMVAASGMQAKGL